MGIESINGQLEMGMGGVNTRHRPINGTTDRAHTFLLYCVVKTAMGEDLHKSRRYRTLDNTTFLVPLLLSQVKPKYICRISLVLRVPARSGQAIQCDTCSQWQHRTCNTGNLVSTFFKLHIINDCCLCTYWYDFIYYVFYKYYIF